MRRQPRTVPSSARSRRPVPRVAPPTFTESALLVGGVEQPAGLELSTATSNATLSATNYNVVSWSAVTGATSYNVYRSTTTGTEAEDWYVGDNVVQRPVQHGRYRLTHQPAPADTLILADHWYRKR
jgi:hypothetical protein